MKNMLLVAGVCLLISMSGCATSGNGCCGSGQSGLFGGNRLFQNNPVQDTVRSWFQGDSCSTCNPPAGITTANYGSNTAPLCNSCGNTLPLAPDSHGVSLYDNTSLNAPITSSVAPAYPEIGGQLNQGITLGVPSGTVEAGYGEIPAGPSF